MSGKLGVLGGMGPLATAKAVERVIDLTRAETDQEHIPMVITNSPGVPDRTISIGSGDDSIVEILARDLELLDLAGVQSIIMPCNTAHYYLEKLQSRSRIPMINMVGVTLDYVSQVYPGQAAMVLGSQGLYDGQVYQRFEPPGVRLDLPTGQLQRELMRIITEIKAGGELAAGARQVERLISEHTRQGQRGGVAILACTEFSLLQNYLGQGPVPVVDAAEVLAATAILRLGYEVRAERTTLKLQYLG